MYCSSGSIWLSVLDVYTAILVRFHCTTSLHGVRMSVELLTMDEAAVRSRLPRRTFDRRIADLKKGGTLT